MVNMGRLAKTLKPLTPSQRRTLMQGRWNRNGTLPFLAFSIATIDKNAQLRKQTTMNEENPYLRPAFDEGAARARLCISRNDDPTMCSNPYLPSTDDFRAWNLGWNTTLMSEIRTPPRPPERRGLLLNKRTAPRAMLTIHTAQTKRRRHGANGAWSVLSAKSSGAHDPQTNRRSGAQGKRPAEHPGSGRGRWPQPPPSDQH